MRALFVGALAGTLLLPQAQPLSAQTTVDFAERSNWLVGYVVNAPQQLLGFGTGVVLSRLGGFGVYVDAKLTHDSPARDSGFLENMTPQEAMDRGDIFFKDDSAWTTVNIAVVKGISEELALYLGAGPSWRTFYSQFEETPPAELSPLGLYWVEDEVRSEVHANVIAGGFFRMGNRVVFQFGAGTAPAGFTAGFHFLLR